MSDTEARNVHDVDEPRLEALKIYAEGSAYRPFDENKLETIETKSSPTCRAERERNS